MTYSEKHKLLFIHTPKCSGITMSRYLLNLSNEFKKVNVHGRQYRNIEVVGGIEKWKEYYKFAFIRNPYTRMVSRYLHGFKKVHKPKLKEYTKNWVSFKEYLITGNTPYGINVYDFMKLPMYDYLEIGTELEPNFIGRFENLSNDWDVIRKNNPQVNLIPFTALVEHNIGLIDQEYYQGFYTIEVRDIVTKLFKKDLDYFGYTWPRDWEVPKK